MAIMAIIVFYVLELVQAVSLIVSHYAETVIL